MKDINGVEIKVGDLVKRKGLVKYAHDTILGETVMREKISRKTWKISKVENDELYYENRFTDWEGNEVVEHVKLNLPKHEGGFLVVGDSKGFKKEFLPKETVKIGAGSVKQNYEVLKDVPSENWKKGDVVSIVGQVHFDMLKNGILKKTDKKHQHTKVVVDTIKIVGN